EQLAEADRRKDEFLAILSHELRNPLAPLRTCLHLLKKAGNDSTALQQFLPVMERQLSQLVRLVDDLLNMSRLTHGRVELRKERIELSTAIAGAVEISRPLIEQRGHELHVVLPDETVPLYADPVRLAQVFGNLLNNAAKYTDRGGNIWLTAER